MRLMFLLVVIYLSACSPGKQTSGPVLTSSLNTVRLPIWIDYSKSVPDSIREFFKVYLSTKRINIISMKDAMELMMNNSADAVMKKIQSENITTEREINEIVKQSMKQAVCSKISINLFQNKIINESQIDSIRWEVMPMPIIDTIQKASIRTYYPSLKHTQNVYLQWRALADTILNSGLLR